ncbi:hypothetical protein [Herbaspirillum rubrisubalbicans]|uniref:hypothetical protein n=1 Tax=Herbaspirillum rubrisubalbicans TaxID=80842 RepID=UPI0003697D1A|nr:hypothetical protein [Herbaspirillum rubrisubalbicans]
MSDDSKLNRIEDVLQPVFLLAGGKEHFFQIAEKEAVEISKKWDLNIEAIGRILRAHLFVEHYLTEHLQRVNPHLGPLLKAKLSFSQKVELIDRGDSYLANLVPGLRRIGSIRNRLAHQLDAAISAEDVEVFLQNEIFVVMREERCKPEPPSAQPLIVLEEFSQHAANWLHATYSEVGKLMRRAGLGIPAGREP